MYERFKNDVLVRLSDLPVDILQRISKEMDAASTQYTVMHAETSLAVIGREQFKKIAGAYLITKKTEGLANSSLAQMARILNNFILATTRPIDEIKSNEIRAYLYNYQATRNISNRSLDFLRTIICAFFHWCASEGYITTDPASNIKPIKYVRKPRKALTQIELERVRRACKSERETCIVELLYSTGCRVSEICNIKIQDVNWDKREIVVFGKGGKYRKVYLNAKAIISLQVYLNNRKHQSPYLLCNDRGGKQMTPCNIQKFFRRIEKQIGIDVSPHIMRHTMATQALTGTGVEVVQQMLGHSSIATTMIYAEVDKSSIHTAHIRSVI